MSLANSFIQGATAILKLGGSTGTLTKTTNWAYDPETGQATNSENTYSIRCSNPSHIERWENGSLVRQGEDSLIIGSKGLTVVPEVGDRITIGEATWTITTVEEVQAQNVTIYYQATVKK